MNNSCNYITTLSTESTGLNTEQYLKQILIPRVKEVLGNAVTYVEYEYSSSVTYAGFSLVKKNGEQSDYALMFTNDKGTTPASALHLFKKINDTYTQITTSYSFRRVRYYGDAYGTSVFTGSMTPATATCCYRFDWFNDMLMIGYCAFFEQLTVANIWLEPALIFYEDNQQECFITKATNNTIRYYCDKYGNLTIGIEALSSSIQGSIKLCQLGIAEFKSSLYYSSTQYASSSGIWNTIGDGSRYINQYHDNSCVENAIVVDGVAFDGLFLGGNSPAIFVKHQNN